MAVQVLGNFAVVIFREKLADGAPIVPQEAVGVFAVLLMTTPVSAGSHGTRIVAAPLLEFFEDVIGPVLRSYFDAVGQQPRDSVLAHHFRANRVGIHLEIAVDIVLHILAVQLVDFEAGRFRRSRAVLVAGQRVTDAQNHPVPVAASSRAFHRVHLAVRSITSCCGTMNFGATCGSRIA
jgi:hypothetical protein